LKIVTGCGADQASFMTTIGKKKSIQAGCCMVVRREDECCASVLFILPLVAALVLRDASFSAWDLHEI